MWPRIMIHLEFNYLCVSTVHIYNNREVWIIKYTNNTSTVALEILLSLTPIDLFIKWEAEITEITTWSHKISM